MNLQAEFDEARRIVWGEPTHSPQTTPPSLQSAMFTDRADLWPMRRKGTKRSQPPKPGQLPLESTPNTERNQP